MRIRSKLFQPLQDCARVFLPARGWERYLIILLLPVQPVRQGTFFQAYKSAPICPGPGASVPQHHERRHIHVFQPLPDSLAHVHRSGIQHIHSRRPVANEYIRSIPEDGRDKVL